MRERKNQPMMTTPSMTTERKSVQSTKNQTVMLQEKQVSTERQQGLPAEHAQRHLLPLGNGFGSRGNQDRTNQRGARACGILHELVSGCERLGTKEGIAAKPKLPTFALGKDDGDLLRTLQLFITARQHRESNERPGSVGSFRAVIL